jgi:hypothetical protein
MVLDGIVRYGDDTVIVLESKLSGPDHRQASNINLHGQPVAFDGGVRNISWHDILATFTDIASEERGLIAGAERISRLPISLSRFGVADSAETERWGGHCHGA